MIQLLWALLAFLFGALPFSVWLGQRALGRDIRDYGDKNPGATNVLRAGNFAWFSVALLLDISKGALPVGAAYHLFGWRGLPMMLIAIMPPLGHAFSPFLKWRGGKAVATSFGVWIGVGLWQLALPPLLLLVVWSLIVRPSGWAIMLTMFSLAGYLLWRNSGSLLLVVWLQQTLLFAWRYDDDLRQQPGWFLVDRLRRNKSAA